jgi:glycosyltransferase involved in cell wall biosynthesis
MKGRNALVSIIVPIYGTEAYLPSCIDSLCNQSYKNLQIILVDDESPDKCPKICDSYAEKDDRIIVIHQKNMGVSGARNTGLSSAAGDYVMFVDSDDELYLNAVEILLNDAAEYGADIVWAPKQRDEKNGYSENGSEDNSYTVFQGDQSLLLSLNGEFNTDADWSKLFKK